MEARTLSARIAEDIAFVPSSRISKEAMAAALLRLVDTVGVTLAGASSPEGQSIYDLVLSEDAETKGGALVWGTGRRVPLHRAVLANGIAAHALDYDDSCTHAGLHPGAIVVPVALGIAEREGCSASEVLQAIVVGYQAAGFLGRFTFGKFPGSASTVCGMFAAVVVACRLRKVSPAVAVNALGLAGSFASGTTEYLASGGESKPLQHGWAAHSAIYAVSLAQRGAVGPTQIFEGQFGIFRAMARMDVDPGIFTEDPWARLEVFDASTKPYPVCHSVVPVASAWLELLEELRRDGVDPFTGLESILLMVPDYAARFMLIPIEMKRRPATAHQARFSFPWCLGKLALDGKLDLKSFDKEYLEDERVLSLAAKVEYEITPRSGVPYAVPGAVRVVTKAGKTIEKSRSEHWGGPTDPFTEAQVIAKFLETGEMAGSEAELRSFLRAVNGLTDGAGMTSFFSALGALRGFSVAKGASA